MLWLDAATDGAPGPIGHAFNRMSGSLSEMKSQHGQVSRGLCAFKAMGIKMMGQVPDAGIAPGIGGS